MKAAGIISIVLIAVYTLMALGQLWFVLMDWETFIKVTITFGVLLVATVIIALIMREYGHEQRMRKDKYID